MDIEEEAKEMTSRLRGKTVKIVLRHRANEVLLEFEDNTRLFVNVSGDGLDFSVTEGWTSP